LASACEAFVIRRASWLVLRKPSVNPCSVCRSHFFVGALLQANPGEADASTQLVLCRTCVEAIATVRADYEEHEEEKAEAQHRERMLAEGHE
jgi:hypothetical protein